MSHEKHDRQTATVLAALRFWQRCGLKKSRPEQDIATDGGRLQKLSVRQIDRLAESINLGELALSTVPPASQEPVRMILEDGIVCGVRIPEVLKSQLSQVNFSVRHYESDDSLEEDRRTGTDSKGRDYYDHTIDVLEDDT